MSNLSNVPNQLRHLKSISYDVINYLLGTEDQYDFFQKLSFSIRSLNTADDLARLLLSLPLRKSDHITHHFSVHPPLIPSSGLSKDDKVNVMAYYNSELLTLCPRETICFSIDDCRVIGYYGIILTPDGEYVSETIKSRWFPVAMQRTIDRFGIIVVFKELLYALFPRLASDLLPCAFHFFNRGAYANGQPQYGHFILENLPTLRVYHQLLSVSAGHIPLLNCPVITQWQLDLQMLCGISPRYNCFLQFPGKTVKRLYFSSLYSAGSKDYEVDCPGRRWVHRTLSFSAACYAPPHYQYQPAHKVFISRQHSQSYQNKRVFASNNHLESHLWRHNWTVLHCEMLSTLSEASTLFYAKYLCGQFGSGLCKVMFMRKPQAIVELYSEQESLLPPFFLMSRELGIHYSRVKCTLDREGRWIFPLSIK